MDTLTSLIEGLADGSIAVVDLTQPLSEDTPLIQLPEPFVNTPGWKLRELSHYDDRGPAWYWNAIEAGEHVGTHFDAPDPLGHRQGQRGRIAGAGRAIWWVLPW